MLVLLYTGELKFNVGSVVNRHSIFVLFYCTEKTATGKSDRPD